MTFVSRISDLFNKNIMAFYKTKAIACYERAELEGDDGNARSRLARSACARWSSC